MCPIKTCTSQFWSSCIGYSKRWCRQIRIPKESRKARKREESKTGKTASHPVWWFRKVIYVPSFVLILKLPQSPQTNSINTHPDVDPLEVEQYLQLGYSTVCFSLQLSNSNWALSFKKDGKSLSNNQTSDVAIFRLSEAWNHFLWEIDLKLLCSRLLVIYIRFNCPGRVYEISIVIMSDS